MEQKSMNLFEKINYISVELQNAGLKKTGFNKYGNFKYFQLDDFLPKLNELRLKYGVTAKFEIVEDIATLELRNANKPEELETYKFDLAEYKQQGSTKMIGIQWAGSLQTYCKRYLYMNAFGIAESDTIDAMDNTKESPQTQPQQAKNKPSGKEPKATPKQIELIQKLVDNIPAMLNFYQVNDIKELTVNQAVEVITSKQKKEQVNG